MDKLSLVFREVLSELKVETRSFFELKLANRIAKSSGHLNSVHLVSENFLEILKSNKRLVLENLIKDDSKIFKLMKHELFSEIKFGRILESEINPEEIKTPEDLLDLIYEILRDSRNINLDQLMQIHSVTGYQLLAKFSPGHAENFRDLRALLSGEFKTEISRGRKADAVGEDGKIVRKVAERRADFGFNTSPFFKNLAGKAGYIFEHGMDTVDKSPESPYVKSLELEELNTLPFVCGPSNHTAALLAGAMGFAGLAGEDISEYASGIFSFLARGGHHSFHEVMLIAQRAGVAYVPGKYEPSLPRGLLVHPGVAELFAETNHSALVA